jgi:crotonobetainyl-CoA:carnitine CoA-transferase CaiB-like acyl-CoA transferase
MMKQFQELLVIEIAGGLAGSFAAKLFADYGARVIKVEPSGGDRTRVDGSGFVPGGEFTYLNTSKSSLELDLQRAEGGGTLQKLLLTADVLIESAMPGPHQAATAGMGHEGLVRVNISPFGRWGQYAGFRATSFGDYASGGHMYLTGEPDREPLQGAGRQPEYSSGMHAYIGAVAALVARARDGVGQTVDVSHMEVMASLHQFTTVRYTHGGYIMRRLGNRQHIHPATIYPCKDGHVAVTTGTVDQTNNFLLLVERPDLIGDPRFQSGESRLERWEEFDREVSPWLLAHTADEIVRLGQELRVPVGGVPNLFEILSDEHLNARGFWHELRDGRGVRVPGPPFRLSSLPWNATPSPSLGNAALAELLPSGAEGGAARSPQVPSSEPPLAGIRIADLTRVWAGPLCTRILGDLGADVIKVEAPWSRGVGRVSDEVVRLCARFPNNEAGEHPWNRDGMFTKFNRNKRSLTLRLNDADGKQLFERLVAVSDVVVENYSPRVMPQLGLPFERLAQLNPSIIYAAMPGYGSSGPNRDYVAYGSVLEPAAGLSSIMGYENGGPAKSGVSWADPVAAMAAAAGIVTAIYNSRTKPESGPQYVEVAQLEAMVSFIGGEVVTAQLTRQLPRRIGNRDPHFAPQGCYPCAGDDRWIAITITSDEEWRTLCGLAGFATEFANWDASERARRHDALDALMARWTTAHEPRSLMQTLQDNGVIAVAVMDARDLVENEHLASRAFFMEVDHPECGKYIFPGLPIHLSRTPASLRLPAPMLGQHNAEVLGKILDLTPHEIRDLEMRGRISTEPML